MSLIDMIPRHISYIVHQYIHRSRVWLINCHIKYYVQEMPPLISDQLTQPHFYWSHYHKNIFPDKCLTRYEDSPYWILRDYHRPSGGFAKFMMPQLRTLDGCFSFINGYMHLSEFGGKDIKLAPIPLWCPTYNRLSFFMSLSGTGFTKIWGLTELLDIVASDLFPNWSYDIEQPYDDETGNYHRFGILRTR